MDDEELPDWEVHKEEKVPPRLEEKWSRRERRGMGTVRCRSCGQAVPEDSLLCLFCGGRTGVKAGLFSAIREWISGTGTGGLFFLIILVIIAFFLILF